MGVSYWFNYGDANKFCTDALLLYSSIVHDAMNISKLMQKNINVDGYWYDDNSIKIAQWWNAKGKGSTAGKLKYNKGLKKLEIVVSDNSYDGEDRLKNTIQEAGHLYYIAVSKTLATVSTNYPDFFGSDAPTNLVKFSALQGMGDVGAELDSMPCPGKTRWSNLMEGFSKYTAVDKWKSVVLNTTKKEGSVSNTANILTMIDEVRSQLNTMHDDIKAYANHIKKLTTATKPNLWGMTGDGVMDDVNRVIQQYLDKAADRIRSFGNNMDQALKATWDQTGLDMNDLKGKGFSGKFKY